MLQLKEVEELYKIEISNSFDQYAELFLVLSNGTILSCYRLCENDNWDMFYPMGQYREMPYRQTPSTKRQIILDLKELFLENVQDQYSESKYDYTKAILTARDYLDW